jgi:hypothetical protein
LEDGSIHLLRVRSLLKFLFHRPKCRATDSAVAHFVSYGTSFCRLMGCRAFFFGDFPLWPHCCSSSPSSLPVLTLALQAHASNVSCLSFRITAESSLIGEESALASKHPLLLASGGADHCVRMHSITLQG